MPRQPGWCALIAVQERNTARQLAEARLGLCRAFRPACCAELFGPPSRPPVVPGIGPTPVVEILRQRTDPRRSISEALSKQNIGSRSVFDNRKSRVPELNGQPEDAVG